jgi:two-component system sensor histidine kinase CpxA
MEAVEKIDDFAPVSLNQILEEIIPDAKYEASQRQCTVQFTSTGEYSIRGNRLVLYRAIENVVRNAIRYTAQGSAVEIRLFSEPGPKERLAVLDVLDHGPGIPESEIENIFRPFYRVDRARSPETGGFGVGLAITDRAVKLHGGKLQVFNRPEGGACIRMSFSVDTASTLKDRVA